MCNLFASLFPDLLCREELYFRLLRISKLLFADCPCPDFNYFSWFCFLVYSAHEGRVGKLQAQKLATQIQMRVKTNYRRLVHFGAKTFRNAQSNCVLSANGDWNLSSFHDVLYHEFKHFQRLLRVRRNMQIAQIMQAYVLNIHAGTETVRLNVK